MNLNARQQAQVDFLATKQDIEIGSTGEIQLKPTELVNLTPDHECVIEVFNSGLTAIVYKINSGGKMWTVKQRRPVAKVKNIDGETSFLNEVQRRYDFAELQSTLAADHPIKRHIVTTEYASLKHGIIVSPWIEGQHINVFDELLFNQVYATICEMELAGLFEWDLCDGNLLVAGGELKLFDFGYMYRFDPLVAFNSEGTNASLFSGVERFETRCLSKHLLALESNDTNAAIQLYRLSKTVALKHYTRKREQLSLSHAEQVVLDWHEKLISRWTQTLDSDVCLSNGYIVDMFRAHALDVEDDVSGKSCTKSTQARVVQVLRYLNEHYDLLVSMQGLFHGDERLSQAELIEKYQQLSKKVDEYQL